MTPAHSASSRSASLLGALALGVGVALFVAAPGCSSDTAATTDAGAAGSVGLHGGACPTPTPSTGADDSCTADGGPINQEATSCPTTPGAADSDAGGDEMSVVHNGTTSPDDDCKYDVSYVLDCSDGSAAFVITLKSRTTGMLLTGAEPYIEAFLGDTHPLPSPNPVTTVVSDGVYKISGVHFDATGIWTVRFHLFGMCEDTGETSKHAHVAFAVNVP